MLPIAITPCYVTNEQGEPVAVQISIKEFEELTEFLEDLDDIQVMKERMGEAPTIPHEEIVAELMRDGILQG